jgi:REP element-mobilizing transposase RayT
MARPLRVQYPNAVYHITCRGNEQKPIFRDDRDRSIFLKKLIESMDIYGVKLHGYVLMSNHFHLLLETPLGNLGEFMRRFNISYTGYFNYRYKRSGHLYQGRYKSILVDKDNYLSILSRYIHLNPIRTRLFEKASPRDKTNYLRRYRWSSLPGYLDKRKKESFIEYAVVLGGYGGDAERGRRGYLRALYEDIEGALEIRGKIIGQSILGGEEFVTWVDKTFLKGKGDLESSSVRTIKKHLGRKEILRVIEEVTGKTLGDMIEEKGILRQMGMELLCRAGGLKGPETGELFRVGYTSVSQERRRLRNRLSHDRDAQHLFKQLLDKCHD